MEKELRMAEALQSSILPGQLPEIPGINMDSLYVSMEHIGGDYYDIFPLSDNRIGILIADVSGHGVPAALVTMMVKVAFTSYSGFDLSSDLILEKINKELVKVLGIEILHYVTAFYLILDYQHNVIQFSSAGHPSQFLYSKENNEIHSLKTYGRFLGIDKNSIYGKKIMFLNKGDKIILFTDGIVEARNEKNEQYSVKKLKELIMKNNDLKAESFIKLLEKDLNIFCGDMKQSDDRAMFVIDVNEDKTRDDIIENLKEKQKEIDKLKNTANKYYNKGDFKKAAELMIQAMFKEGKNNANTMKIITDYYIEADDLKNAVEYLEYAVSIEPENNDLRKRFYDLYDKLRKSKE